MTKPNPHKPKYYVRFEAPPESLHKAAALNCSRFRAFYDAIWEQWTIAYVIIAGFFIGIATYRSIKAGEPSIYDLFCAGVLAVPAFPFILIRFLNSYRILRRGVAVVGTIASDSSPFTTSVLGKKRPTKYNRLRMIYTYYFQGKQYSGVTGDSTLRARGIIPIRQSNSAKGEVKIILIDPEDPETSRATPYDIVLSKPVRKRIAEDLGLTVLL